MENLKMLFRSPTWGALVALRDEMAQDYASGQSTTQTEWDYLSESLRNDGRKEGIMSFLKRIEGFASSRDM